MKFSRPIYYCSVIRSLWALSCCYRLYFKLQIEKNLRRHLHIPDDIKSFSFDSNPEKAGFFGRERLRIRAVFLLPGTQLKNFEAILNDAKMGEPVSLSCNHQTDLSNFLIVTFTLLDRDSNSLIYSSDFQNK